jgi:hypothetical protein
MEAWRLKMEPWPLEGLETSGRRFALIRSRIRILKVKSQTRIRIFNPGFTIL